MKFEVNEKEFEYVLNVLAQRPFAEVNALLQKLVNQANMTKNITGDLAAECPADLPPSQ
jgi:hypothetical protein